MKSYYGIMLGAKSMYADECLKGDFIGADFGIDFDLLYNKKIVYAPRRQSCKNISRNQG